MTSHQTSAAFMKTTFAGGKGLPAAPVAGAQAALLAERAPWRTSVAAAVLAYQAAAGAMLALWLLWSQRASSAEAAGLCAIPLLLTAWLVWRAEPDARQFIAQLFAAVIFGPLLLAFVVGDRPSAIDSTAWPFMLGGALLHVAALLGAVIGLGGYVTRVAAAPGVMPVHSRLLRERLASLIEAEVPVSMFTEPCEHSLDSRLVFHVRLSDPLRSHRIVLQLDATQQRVRVFERTDTHGARALTAGEASMRQPGEPSLYPTRPDAQAISGTTWQTTMISPQRMAGLRLQLAGSQATLARPQARALDAEGVVTVLCAVVTRSGWAWQPAWRG